MADVFLSYAHADRKIVQRLAQELSAAGLSVWLDREIHGGAEFSKMIERELAEARRVVVVWSPSSIDSRWVRDEASLALEANKLVPVSIGATLPPLGFRQLQAVVLDDWTRSRAPLPASLWRALDADTAPVAASGSRRRHRYLITAGAAGAILAIIAGLAFWTGLHESGEGDGKVLAVAPLQVASDDGPASALKQTLTSDLTRLALGHDAQLNFVASGDRTQDLADFSLAGSASSNGDQLRANVRLTQGQDGIILWSSEFEGAASDVPALRQRMAVKLADVLICALGSRSKRPADIDLPTLRLFLSGCENMHPAVEADWKVAAGIFEQVVARRPDFAQARALLAQSLALTVGDFSRVPQSEWGAARRRAIEEAHRALELDPDLGAAYSAISMSYGYGLDSLAEKLRNNREGLARDPDVADLHNSQAVIFAGIGKPAEALAETEKAAALDPFAPLIASNLIEAYAYAGRKDDATKLLDQSELYWPGNFYIDWMRFKVPARMGDAGEALKLLDSGELSYKPSNPALWRLFLAARINPTGASKEAFRKAAMAASSGLTGNGLSDTIESLAQLGLIDDAYRLALDGPPLDASWNFIWFAGTMKDFRRDPRFLQVMARQKLVRFWRANHILPEFCTRENLPYDCNLS